MVSRPASARDGAMVMAALSRGEVVIHYQPQYDVATGAMTGGHLLPGCIIRTTAELVLGLAATVAFRRVEDPATGYPELGFSPTA